MVQHIIVTWTPSGIQTVPQSINIWTDDQELKFILGPDTEWGPNPVVFNKLPLGNLSIQPWTGSDAEPGPKNTIRAKGPGPVSELTMYAYTVSVTQAGNPATLRSHDPEIYNQPQP